MKLFEISLKSSPQFRVLVMLLASFFVVMLGFSLANFDGNKMRMNDMGNMVQAIYNTTKGRTMEFSNAYIYEDPMSNRIGGHANLIFFLFVPIYWLFSEPKVLVLIQVAMVSSAMIPLYLLGGKYFGEKSWWSVWGPFLYAINPVIQDVVLFDFHALVLAMPIFIWTVYFLLMKRYRWFFAGAVLLALCKEDMPLVVLVMGLFMWWRMKEPKKGVLVAGMALIYFGMMVGVVMPLLRNGQKSLVQIRYSEVFEGGYGINRIVGTLVDGEKLRYFPEILMTVGGVGVLAPEILAMALPSMAVNLLSSNKTMMQIYGYYYPALIMAVVMVASVVGFARLKEKKQKYWREVSVGVIAVSVVMSFLNSPLPYSKVSSFEEFRVSGHAKKMDEVVKIIPADASVSVQNNLGYKMANRRSIITFPYKSDEAEYVILDVTDPYVVTRVLPRQRNFVYITNLSLEVYRDRVEEMFDNENYGVFYSEDGYLIFKKKESREKNNEAYKNFEEKMGLLEESYRKFVTEYGQ